MPLDIQMFREYQGGDPAAIKASQVKRFASVEIVDEIIEMDSAWRKMTGDIDNLKKAKNAVQKEVGKKMKAKEECAEMVQEVKDIGVKIIKTEEEQKALHIEITKKLNTVGNIVYDDVPIGNDEEDKHNGNRVERTWGTPKKSPELLSHHDLLWRIGGYEPERGAAVAGHRGYYLTGPGVLLNQAFQAYGTAFLGKRGYTPIQPPYMMKKEIMAGVAQLSQFDEELYKLSGGQDDGSSDKYLIATSEQPICAFHMNEWVREDTLPKKYCGLSTCFRKEAGSHGRDTWGIFRVHQFEKVEQFVVTENNLETSSKMQNEMIQACEEFYQSLGFPYQVINIVSGALNNAAIKKLDLECWFPGYDSYRELVSCSNCTDYQSRSMEIRCGQKKLGDREKRYVHMLNSTLCATGRAICCLLENYQEADGVRIPEALVPFMGGVTFLPFTRGPMDVKGGDATKKADAPKKTDAPKKEEAPKAAASAPVAAPVADGPFAAEIAAKGDEVRKLKADKADKDLISKAIEELKALKIQANPNAGVDNKAEKKQKQQQQQQQKTAEKKSAAPKVDPALALPPAVPILAPKYTTSAPPLPLNSASTASGVYTDNKLDLQKLDTLLINLSYIGGYLPSKADNIAMNEIQDADTTKFPNVTRWYRNVKSFPEDDAAKWI